MIQIHEQAVSIASHGRLLEGDLGVPERALGLVLFAPGSGGDRHGSSEIQLARTFHHAHLATLRLELLTPSEEMSGRWGINPSTDINLLASRLLSARAWLLLNAETQFLPLGYFGEGLGTAAALVAIARQPERITALVSRGGRPELVPDVLPLLNVPSLFIIGANDTDGLPRHQHALDAVRGEKSLRLVPGASSALTEPGALEDVARMASEWFRRCFRAFSQQSAYGWTDEQGRSV
jgi:putative phosphoribosyl transferase